MNRSTTTRTSTTRAKQPARSTSRSAESRDASHGAKPTRRAASASALLSATQRKILQSFRTFLMRPGQMLCFSTHDLREWRSELAQLTRTGLLVAERFPGGYSLTSAGFHAMRDG